MRAWSSCAVSMLASATHSARAFVPGAGANFRSLRRPLQCNSGRTAGQPGRGMWVVQRRGGAEPAAGIWQQGGRVRLLSTAMSSGSSGAVQEVRAAGEEEEEVQEWTVTKVKGMRVRLR